MSNCKISMWHTVFRYFRLNCTRCHHHQLSYLLFLKLWVLKIINLLSFLADSSPAVPWQHCYWDRWADPVCSECRCPGDVPWAAASPKAQYPERSSLDDLQHHRWQGLPDSGGYQCRADSNRGGDPPTGQDSLTDREYSVQIKLIHFIICIVIFNSPVYGRLSPGFPPS